MGVRFACHACGKRLNIKAELAGRRGICPACSTRFRIPLEDTETSTPVEASETLSPLSGTGSGVSVSHSNGSDASTRAQAAVQPTIDRTETHASTSAIVGNSTTQAAPAASPQLLSQILGDTSATWYVRPPSGGQYGPADGPTMGQWISEGRVADASMLWRDGWPDWRPAKEILPGPAAQDPSTSVAAAVTPSPAPPSPVQSAITSDASAVDSPDPTDINLRPGSKTLASNKNKASNKRMVATVTLGLVFAGLLGVFVFVLTHG